MEVTSFVILNATSKHSTMNSKLLLITTILFIVFLTIHCNDSPKRPSMVDDLAEGVKAKTINNHFADFCGLFKVPEGTTETFKLPQDYPTTYDVNEPKPWTEVDFKSDYKAYMKTLLAYCMEGNVEVDFKVQNNKVRQWYCTPWMDNDGNQPGVAQNTGRECLHGLTREITIPIGELHPDQVKNYQTYAIAFYNEPGGYAIGQVWADPLNPKPALGDFPEGTVSFKLLFTEADPNHVPFIANSKKWTANIFHPYDENKVRTNHDVRLVQLDVSVKDSRAQTGWVYGTFVHDGAGSGATWLDRMVPVGVSFGHDSDNSSMLNTNDKINSTLKQSIINAELLVPDGKVTPANRAFVRHLGQGGRMNGPVDNPISSCMSCHAFAAVTPDGHPAKIANFGKEYTLKDFNQFFGDRRCGTHTFFQNDDNGKPIEYTATDFSFQISNGIRNYYNLKRMKENPDSEPHHLPTRTGHKGH